MNFFNVREYICLSVLVHQYAFFLAGSRSGALGFDGVYLFLDMYNNISSFVY